MTTRANSLLLAARLIPLIVAAPHPARAIEVSGGVGVGAVVTSNLRRLAISPHVAVSWRMSDGFSIAIHERLNVTTSKKSGAGLYNQLSGAIGYAWDQVSFSVGPAFSIYSLPA